MDLRDRTAAAESVVADEERSRSPLIPYVERIADFLPSRLRPVVKTFVASQSHRVENLEYLHDALRDDVRDLRIDFEKMTSEQGKFYREEIPPLIIDAYHKAEELRSKSRIVRIAKILMHALQEGPACSADYSEEMMRVATALDDSDVEVLRQIVTAQRGVMTGGDSLDLNSANEAWKATPPKLPGRSAADVTSICHKLESFGLIVQVERRKDLFGLETVGLPFSLLKKGLDFVNFALSETEKEISSRSRQQ